MSGQTRCQCGDCKAVERVEAGDKAVFNLRSRKWGWVSVMESEEGECPG